MCKEKKYYIYKYNHTNVIVYNGYLQVFPEYNYNFHQQNEHGENKWKLFEGPCISQKEGKCSD